MVRSDAAIRRHQTLVNSALSLCWNTWFAFAPSSPAPGDQLAEPDALPGPLERGRTGAPAAPTGLLAPGTPGRPWLADALGHAATLLAGMVDEAPTRSTPGTDQHRRHRQTPGPLLPGLTNHRKLHVAPRWRAALSFISGSTSAKSPGVSTSATTGSVASGKPASDRKVVSIASYESA